MYRLSDNYRPQLSDVQRARQRIASVVLHTPLTRIAHLSETFGAEIFLKREDLQVVRSYKIRGAYNKIAQLSDEELAHGVVCASAGNHAQGVALAAHSLGVKAKIFMPLPTPRQKIDSVRMFGREDAEIVLVGDTFDESLAEAVRFCEGAGAAFIHPFNDPHVIEGQGTVGLDILNDSDAPVDWLFLPVGGGGLAAGVSSVFRAISPETKIVGVEAAGAASMRASLDAGHRVRLDRIDTFADGIAVAEPGELSFDICRENLDDVVVVPEGKICTTILDLYDRAAIVVEPAGAASIAALSLCADQIRGRRVVCVVSGSNNDITRMEEIKERSMLYEGTKHYFIVRFPQRAGALREFLEHVLGPDDDITYFQYTKKNSRDRGPAVVGLEIPSRDDLEPLIQRMKESRIECEYLNDKPDLLRLI